MFIEHDAPNAKQSWLFRPDFAWNGQWETLVFVSIFALMTLQFPESVLVEVFISVVIHWQRIGKMICRLSFYPAVSYAVVILFVYEMVVTVKTKYCQFLPLLKKNTCPSGIPSFSYTESKNSNISYLIRNSFIILFFNSVTLEYESYQNVRHFPRHLKGAWLQSQVSLFPNLELAILVLSGIVQIYQRLWGSKISWIYMEYMLWLLKHLNCFTTKTLPLCNSSVNKVWSSLFRTE